MNVEQRTVPIVDVKTVEIIMRFDRLRRVAEMRDAQAACGLVALPVQYVEDVGHLLRNLNIEIPRL